MRYIFLICVLSIWYSESVLAQDVGQQCVSKCEEQGRYFYKKSYDGRALPSYEQMQRELPAPIFEENSLWVQAYWKAWQIAVKNFQIPMAGSGFVTPFIDAGFNRCIYLWDMAFISMFSNYGGGLIPDVTALDNFYVKQHPDGEICREIWRESGLDRWPANEGTTLYSKLGWLPLDDFAKWDLFPPKPVHYIGREAPLLQPRVALDGLNHPILAWAEWEHYQLTGDRTRLKQVWEPLVRYFIALKELLRQGNGTFMTDRSGMDNARRNDFLVDGGTAVDISSEMSLFAHNLADMAGVLGRKSDRKRFLQEADTIAQAINTFMWDEEKRFYYDLTLKSEKIYIKSVSGFWPLIGRVASPQQAAGVIEHLTNPNEFWRLNPVPSLAADELGYVSTGGYWNGAVWPSVNMMVIKGLEQAGYDSLARVLALKDLHLAGALYARTGTFWENCMADSVSPGVVRLAPTVERLVVSDFVGWSGMAPIRYLLEYAIGLHANGPKGVLTWNLNTIKRVGCERFRFGGVVTSLIADPQPNGTFAVHIESDEPYTLILKSGRKSRRVRVGRGAIMVSI